MKGEKFFEAFGNINGKYAKSAESHFRNSEKREKMQNAGKIIYYVISAAALAAIILGIWIPSVILKNNQINPAVTDTETVYQTGTGPVTEEDTAAADTNNETEKETEPVTEPATTAKETSAPAEQTELVVFAAASKKSAFFH